MNTVPKWAFIKAVVESSLAGKLTDTK
jgi:hypothetical protein